MGGRALMVVFVVVWLGPDPGGCNGAVENVLSVDGGAASGVWRQGPCVLTSFLVTFSVYPPHPTPFISTYVSFLPPPDSTPSTYSLL